MRRSRSLMLSRSRCAVVFKSGQFPGDSLHCRATADGILPLPFSCFIFLLHRAHTALEIFTVSCNDATILERSVCQKGRFIEPRGHSR